MVGLVLFYIYMVTTRYLYSWNAIRSICALVYVHSKVTLLFDHSSLLNFFSILFEKVNGKQRYPYCTVHIHVFRYHESQIQCCLPQSCVIPLFILNGF